MNKIVKSYVDWIAAQNCDVKLDLTFQGNPTPAQASKMVQHFWNCIDEKVFGRWAFKKGIKATRHCFQQYGAYGHNVHYHCLAKTPAHMTQAKFLTMLQLQWNDLGKDGRMNYGKKKYCRFEAIDYVVAATIYASRDAFKNGIYDYDTNCSFAESRSAQCTLVDD